MTRDGPLPLKELRRRLLELSKRQLLLRQLLLNYQAANDVTLNAIALKANANWKSVRDLVGGTLCMCSGQSLTGLCQLVDRPQLAQEIMDLAEPLNDRQRGLGCFNADVINTALDVHEAYQGRANRTTMVEFAEVFGDRSATVASVLMNSQDAVRTLGDNSLQESILDTLADDGFDARLDKILERNLKARTEQAYKLKDLEARLVERYGQKKIVAAKLGASPSTMQEAVLGSSRISIDRVVILIQKAEALLAEDPADPAVRFKDLYQRLFERYGSQVKVSEAIDVPRSTIRHAVNGTCTTEMYLHIIKRAEAELALSAPSSARPAARPSTPPVVDAPPSPKPVVTPEPNPVNLDWATAAGTTTEQGVRFVLTEASFRPLKDVQYAALRDFMQTAFEMARAALAIGSQLEDKATRDLLKKELADETQELQYALQTFVFSHPKRMLPVYDDQRDVLAGKDNPPTTRG